MQNHPSVPSRPSSRWRRLSMMVGTGFVTLLSDLSASAQDWVVRTTGNQTESARALAIDAGGNIYLAGYFQTNATFGSGGGAVTLAASGASDVFLAKYDANSNFVWAVKAGGPLVSVPNSIEQAGGVAVDSSGNAFLTGYFHGNGIFAGGGITNILTSAGAEDVFLAKYSPAGTLLWAKRIGGDDAGGDLSVGGVATDSFGNAFLAVSLQGSNLTVGGTSPQLILPVADDRTVFLLKFAADGSVPWFKYGGGTGSDTARAIALDSAGNIHIIVSVSSPTNAVFGEGTNQVSLSFTGSPNVALLKYATNGNLIWARTPSSSEGSVTVNGLALDNSANAYLAGFFTGPLTFGTGPSAVTLTNVSSLGSDGYLAKYNGAGGLVWAQAFGSALGSEGCTSVAVDNSGNPWVAGTMQYTTFFGSGPGAIALYDDPGPIGFGTSESYLAQFNGSGLPLGAFKIGASNGTPSIGAIVARPALYAAGSFSGTAVFSASPVLRLTSSGSSDLWLAKYGNAIANSADIGVRATVDKPTPPYGDTVTFTVTVTNGGPSTAGLVRVRATVPVGLTSVTITPSRGSYTNSTGIWDIGLLTNNTSATLAISGVSTHSSPITLNANVWHSDRMDPVVTNIAASATSQALLQPGSSLLVTNTLNGGLGSLRNAIEFANSKANTGGPDVITFAIPASDPGRNSNGVCTIRLTFPLPLVTDPVIIDGLTQPGSDNTSWPPALKIMIAGTNSFSGGNGLHLTAGNSTVRGLAIDGFLLANDNLAGVAYGGAAICIEGPGSNTITCNFIGTDTSGTNASTGTRQRYGVRIVNSPNNTIGGTNVSRRNLIADNDDAGIRIENAGATNNVMVGNFIGTTVTGLTNLANGVGVEILDAPRNIIGAPDHDAGVCNNGCNLISGNDEAGILIDGFSSTSPLAAGQRIVGNFIGVNVTGTNALPNKNNGIFINDAGGGHIIGSASDPGVCSKGGNLISGNQANGIAIRDSKTSGLVIQGNFIGTDATGTRAIANTDSGIQIWNHGNIVGGAAPGLGNLISGNTDEGINISISSNNIIQGNLIGVTITGTNSRPNGSHGILLSGGNNLIGGTNTAERNLIAFNVGHGLVLANLIGAPNFGNRFLGNLIFGNSGQAIDLVGDGLNANDPDDEDTGPNELQNYPVLNSLPTTTDAGSTTVSGTLQSKPSTSYRIEFYANPSCDTSKFGEGQSFIGALQVTTSPSGTATFNQVFATPAVPAGWVVTTTATGPDGTSEFSQCADFPSHNIVTSTANSGVGSFRDALLYAGANPGPDTIIFNIPTNDIGYNASNDVWTIRATGSLPFINHPVTIDGLTQPGANGSQWPPQLKIILQRGLVLAGNSNVIRGLVINSVSGAAISLDGVGNVVQGNFIGTDHTGTQRRSNTGAGVILTQNLTDTNNLIGGPLPSQRNLISANGTGISFFNSAFNIIENNYIGTDVTGTTNLGNNGPGINVSTRGNIIRSNLVSGNGLTAAPGAPDVTHDMTSDCGIFIRNDDNIVQGNFVGTDVSGTLSVSNRGSGIEIMGGEGNLIGGTNAGAANRIAFNGDDGIELQAAHPETYPVRNRLLGNSIFSNTRFGIDLGNDGVSVNDSGAGDVDQFWNMLQNFPEISLAGIDTNSNQLIIDYRVTSDPLNTAYPIRVEFFHADAANQEGQIFLGADEFTLTHYTKGVPRTFSFTPLSSMTVTQRVVATATDAAGNTSEFSSNAVLVARMGLPKLNIARAIGSPGTIEITWPNSYTNLQLQRAFSLSAPVNWQPVSAGIVESNGVMKYVIPAGSGMTNHFYRLRQP